MADNITAKDTGGNYERPPEGGHAAVCCDVIDLGYRFNRNFGKVEHKCAILFQLAEKNAAGKRFEIANVLTVSFNEKANLRKFLSQWRGKSYSDDEARTGAPLHKLEGQPAYITIEHKVVGDKTYANIIGVTKLPMGLPILQPEGYTRSEHWKKGSLNEAEAQKFQAQGLADVAPGSPTVGPEDFEDYAASLAASDGGDPDLPF